MKEKKSRMEIRLSEKDKKKIRTAKAVRKGSFSAASGFNQLAFSALTIMRASRVPRIPDATIAITNMVYSSFALWRFSSFRQAVQPPDMSIYGTG